MAICAAAVSGQISVENEILDTRTPPAAARWDDLLTLQTDLFFQHELDGFLQNEDWLKAATVLDVGCGNGYYVSRLASSFPEKTYVGIDTSSALIANARTRPRTGTTTFLAGDYFTYEPAARCDVILMRFVVQHLTDMHAILGKANTLLSEGGSLFIVEPDLPHSRNLPATPLFMDMLSAYENHAAAKGRIRARLSRLPTLIQREPGWEVARDRRLSIPSVGPFVGEPLAALFSRWIDLCEHAAGFPYPYDAVRQEIEEWGRCDSFSHICLRLIQLKRTGDSPAA
jgi:ubiquinone/menaquinone biosynthesis C-methylase UbiE